MRIIQPHIKIDYSKHLIGGHMSKKYAYIDCFEEIKEIPLRNPFIKYLGNKTLKKHIIKKFPNTIEDILYANSAGYYIKLPVIKQMVYEDDDYITNVIDTFNQQLIQYDIDVLVLDNALKKYCSKFNAPVSQGGALGLYYIEEVLEEVKKRIKKPDKDLRYVIIDGPTTDCEYVLDHVTQDMNALTLVTDNPIRYEDKLNEIYTESGLAVQVKSKDPRQELTGDIIIQCNNQGDKLFYCYQDKGILLDFLSSEEMLNQIKIKRPDLVLINKFAVTYSDEKWNADLLLGIILSSDRFIKNMYLYGYRYNIKDRIDKVLKKYPVKFELD